MAVNFKDYNDANYSLRAMTEADLEAVMEIESRSYDFPWTEGIFRDCLRVGYYCSVLLDDDGLACYGIMSLGAGEAHVLNICVKPQCRAQGIGRYMLTHLLDHARGLGASVAVLEVRQSNTAALALYDKMGFHSIGVRKGYYPAFSGREDARVLVCKLRHGSA
ncbi:MAG TPA: ribosomal protein S18-alanine N-acetyltransferase [Gammaproteobacteria bacterium]|nr:ribosomal protein S18-alanine N-acetyltransferase [Gammaproteobacteria bacterium]